MTIQAILQILGGLGVISSIIFTGVQIRRNTRALRAGAYQNVTQSFTTLWRDLSNNAEMTDLMLRSGDDFDALSRVEKARSRFAAMTFMRTYENAYFHHKIGILKEMDWIAVEGDLDGFLARPSGPAIWAIIRSRSGTEFRQYIDDFIVRQRAKAAQTAKPS